MDETKVKDVFAKHIIKLRKNRHMTQGDFADLLGVGVSTVSDWETGKKLPRAGTIEKMARTFNISKSSLFEEENKNPNPSINEKGPPSEDMKLLEELRKLAEEFQMDLHDPKTLDTIKDALNLIKRARGE